MARRIKEEAIVHQERIAKGAMTVFANKGIANTTMDDIAKEAGYGKATLYVYFKNKEDIVSFLSLYSMRILRDSLKEAVEQSGTTKDIFLEICNSIEKFYEEYGLHFIHASDEWYILAERELPEEERYDGYIQLENGVGMMRLLYDEFTEALNNTKADDVNRHVSIVTGKLASNLMESFATMVEKKFKNTKVNVYPIINEFFGESITVSGLLTGKDMLNQLSEHKGNLGDRVLLPANTLRSGEEVFLDDMTLSELANKLDVKVQVPKNTGESLLYNILFENDEKIDDNGNFVYITAYPEIGGKHE